MALEPQAVVEGGAVPGREERAQGQVDGRALPHRGHGREDEVVEGAVDERAVEEPVGVDGLGAVEVVPRPGERLDAVDVDDVVGGEGGVAHRGEDLARGRDGTVTGRAAEGNR